MTADRTTLAFLRIDLQDDETGPQSVRLSTGAGTFYPKTSIWSDYLGSGAMMALSSVSNDTTTASSEFNIDVAIANDADSQYELTNLFEQVKRTALDNRGVCLHAVEIDDPSDTDNLPEPYLVLVGKIANVEITAAKVSLKVYTGATLLNHVVNGPSRYNDLTHKRFIDKDDNCLRFQSDASLRDVYFP